MARAGSSVPQMSPTHFSNTATGGGTSRSIRQQVRCYEGCRSMGLPSTCESLRTGPRTATGSTVCGCHRLDDHRRVILRRIKKKRKRSSTNQSRWDARPRVRESCRDRLYRKLIRRTVRSRGVAIRFRHCLDRGGSRPPRDVAAAKIALLNLSSSVNCTMTWHE